jgi:hypothetical protein
MGTLRSLPEIVQDWRDAAAILLEQAEQLEQLAGFFGGPMAKRAVQVTMEPVNGSPAVTKRITKPGKPHVDHPDKRKLTKAEKDEIRRDYESFPPALRTKVNRLALAAKWNCSPHQIMGVLRDKALLTHNLQRGREQASQGQ